MVKTGKMMLCLAVAAAMCFVCGIVSIIRPRTTMAYDYTDVTGTDNAIVSDFKMINGASVRFVAPTGIRFKSEMPITEYDNLMEEYDNVEIATLLIPTSVLGDNELTVDTANTLKISFTQKFIEDGKVAFKGVLTNIPSTAYTTELTAVSYVKADKTVADVTTTYIQYASFNNEEKASVSRSIAYVSEIALADDNFVKTEDMYLFLTEMAFSNAEIEGSMSATAGSTKTNVAVELKTSYTKNEAALGDNVISYTEYTSESGNIVTDADGKQYFYSASTGSYTVTSTAEIKQNGELNDVVAEKTISVSATAVQNALGNGAWIYSDGNYETDLFVKFLTDDDTATPYTLSYIVNGTALDIMTVNRDGEDYKYGTISLLHTSGMENGGRYAEKGAKLDFSKGVYIKLIKYGVSNNQAVISLYTSQDGETYKIYASAFYGATDSFTSSYIYFYNSMFQTIKLTASAPVFVSGFTATTTPTETKNTTLPKFNVLEVSLTASPDEIRVGENSTLTPSVTFDGDVIADGYEIEYEITSDNEEDASIENGVFTSDVAGEYTVRISVTYAEKTETATATVTVLDNELSATLNFTDTTVETEEETTAVLSVVYNDEDVATGYTVSYSVVSDNSENATVTNAGVFSATANGVYTVRATVSYGGLECYAEKNITVANTVNVEIDLSDTTSVARTNVGVFLYADVSVDGVATDEYDVVFTADGGTVATYDGKYYFYATSAGEYEITATVTIDDVAYEKTTTITVSGSTTYASIYSCDFNADYRDSNGTIDSNVIIGKDGYYYGARNNAVDNALFFNGGYSVDDTYAIELYIEYIGTVSSVKTIFFTMWASSTCMGDGIELVRASGTTNASLTIAGAAQSGTKNFGDGAWLRIVSTTENATHKFKVYVSEDKSTWTLWASANATGNYALNFTGLCLYSQTPVIVADFTVYEDVSMVIDMTDTDGSAYVDETVELASVVTFAGDKLDGVDVVYSIVSGNGSIENGILSANATGDITVSATATYNGFTATTTKTITFNTALTATFTASSNSVEVGDNVTLTLSVNYHGDAIANGYTVEYVISPNEDASVSNGVFTATAEGTYTVTATITHTASRIELSKQVVIAVGSAQPVIAGEISVSANSTTLNIGDATYISSSVTFTIDGVDSNDYTVEYSATGGILGDNGTGDYFYATAANTYTITATLKYNDDVIDTDTVTITVNTNNRTTGSSGTLVSKTDINASGNFELQMYIEFMDPSSVNTLSFVRYQGDANNHAFMKINRNGNNGTIVIEQGNSGRTYYDAAGKGTASTTAAADMTAAGRSLNFANGVHIKLIRYLSGNVATLLIYVSEDGGLTYTPYAKSIYSAWGWYDSTLTRMDITTNFNVMVKNSFTVLTTPTESIPS